MRSAMRTALLAVLLLPTALFAAEGEDLFKSRCAGCHTAQKASARARQLPESERADYLDKFVSRHSPIDEAQRRTVVTYLLAVKE